MISNESNVATTDLNDELTRRALSVVLDKTTDMADDLLRVPLHYYRDPKIAEIEETQVLRRTPLAIVPSAQLPANNDYVVRSVLGDSLLVTRDKEGHSHVFLNYCRHRGAKPACGSGNATRFTCPYHAWTYRNTSELCTVPGKSGFTGMDTRSYGLVELPSEEAYGFIWAVLSADADIDVETHIAGLAPQLAALEYTSFGYHTVREFESDVSWKGALEAFAEFHWITKLGEDPNASCDVRDNMGVIYWIYPNLILANSNVGVEVIDILPAGSPTRCTVRHSWLARIPATSEEQRELYDTIYDAVHAAVRDEDFAMLPQCGEGVRHGQHDHMIIGRNEIGVQHMIKVFAAELGVALS